VETKQIGSLDVTIVGLGCNNFGGRIDFPSTVDVVGAALDEGINFFDTADIYGNTLSEEYLGRALGSHRDEVVVATKWGMPVSGGEGGSAPAYARSAVESSLARLGTDHIDLYQLHRPDDTVPIGETLAALDELVTKGLVREIGCSNFSASQLREAALAVEEGAARFVSVQNHYSILHRDAERDVLRACDELDMAFLPYYPLANGLLTGKYRRDRPFPAGSRLTVDVGRREREISDARLDQIDALEDVALAAGCTLVDLAFAWLLSREVVASVIAGATSAEQVRDNAATKRVSLDSETLASIDEIAPFS